MVFFFCKCLLSIYIKNHPFKINLGHTKYQSKGYLTEDGTHSNRSSNNDAGSVFKNNVSNSGRPLGPLASAIAKPRRRSRSAGPPVTGTPMIHNSVKTSINPKARATPLMKTQSSHTSR